MISIRRICFFLFTLHSFHFSFAQNGITWKEQIVLDNTSKYIRLCKVTKGPAAGDLIMTYFKNDHSAPFGMRKSQDNGRTWSTETIFMKNDDMFYYVNPGILQLDDSRLMLTYCKRSKGVNQYIKEEGPCVKFSSDGGYTWGEETFICWGGAYEPTAIQVPNDKNKDGNNDIYLFWSMAIVDQSVDISVATQENAGRGFACGVVASYDNGKTWENFMLTKLGARIVHRNFNEPVGGTYMGSKGNMPTPVLLPDNRIGVVCEAVDKAVSPWFTVSSPGNWDWTDFQNQAWASYQYIGYPPYNADDDNVYPGEPNRCWRSTNTDDTFGGAPYVCVMPNGKIVFSQNTNKLIKVFVCDPYGKNTVKQEDPFGTTKSFYSCIIPLNDREVIVAAHDPDNMAKIYLRIGEVVKDVQPPTMPRNISVFKEGSLYRINWEPSTDNILVYKYEIYANDSLVGITLWDNKTDINGLNPNKNYSFTVRAMDYQGNYSDYSTEIITKLLVETITVFPNPAGECLTVEIPWEYADVLVFNSLGVIKLHDSHFFSGRLSVSTLESGMYILQVKYKSNIVYTKFIKM